MSRFIRCEGCGAEEQHEIGAEHQPVIRRIHVGLGFDPEEIEGYDLCPTCQKKLRKDANPRNWPRGAPA